MRQLALAVMIVSTIGCQKKDEPKPASDPKPAEAPKPAEKPLEAAKPAGPCVIAVTMTDKITFDGGGVKGESPLATFDAATLKPLAGKCSADIAADDTVSYQDIINVMDKLVAAGITDVGLGGAKSPSPTGPKVALPGPTITGEWSTSKDGKLQLTGHFNEDDKKAALKAAPVIVISKTAVTVFGKSVGKPDDAALGAAIAKALPPNPKSPIAIVQADAGLPFAPIRAAIDAARQSGYDNVLFAVKNR